MQTAGVAPDHLKRFKWPVLVLALLLIVPAAGWYLWQRTYFPGTDDAYLNANVARSRKSCARRA